MRYKLSAGYCDLHCKCNTEDISTFKWGVRPQSKQIESFKDTLGSKDGVAGAQPDEPQALTKAEIHQKKSTKKKTKTKKHEAWITKVQKTK